MEKGGGGGRRDITLLPHLVRTTARPPDPSGPRYVYNLDNDSDSFCSLIASSSSPIK